MSAPRDILNAAMLEDALMAARSHQAWRSVQRQSTVSEAVDRFSQTPATGGAAPTLPPTLTSAPTITHIPEKGPLPPSLPSPAAPSAPPPAPPSLDQLRRECAELEAHVAAMDQQATQIARSMAQLRTLQREAARPLARLPPALYGLSGAVSVQEGARLALALAEAGPDDRDRSRRAAQAVREAVHVLGGGLQSAVKEAPALKPALRLEAICVEAVKQVEAGKWGLTSDDLTLLRQFLHAAT